MTYPGDKSPPLPKREGKNRSSIHRLASASAALTLYPFPIVMGDGRRKALSP